MRPGILARCEVTGKHVLPSELERCTATCRRVLKRLLVNSSLSEARILEDVAIRSLAGRYCAPAEALECFWSGRKTHPDDILACVLTGLPIHVEFTEPNGIARLSPLAELLDGVRRSADKSSRWDNVAARIVSALKGGKCKVEAAVLSPAKKHLATCSEIRTLLGFRANIVGAIYSIDEGVLVGRIAVGKRQGNIWKARS